MTKAKHFPGPWKFVVEEFNRDGDDNTGCPGSVVSDNGEKWFIATVENAPRSEANGRLLASAPALLEALEMLVAQLLDYERVNNLVPSPGRKYCWDATERAVAAITEATGG